MQVSYYPNKRSPGSTKTYLWSVASVQNIHISDWSQWLFTPHTAYRQSYHQTRRKYCISSTFRLQHVSMTMQTDSTITADHTAREQRTSQLVNVHQY